MPTLQEFPLADLVTTYFVVAAPAADGRAEWNARNVLPGIAQTEQIRPRKCHLPHLFIMSIARVCQRTKRVEVPKGESHCPLLYAGLSPSCIRCNLSMNATLELQTIPPPPTSTSFCGNRRAMSRPAPSNSCDNRIMSKAYRVVFECPKGPHKINLQRKSARGSLSEGEAREMFAGEVISCDSPNCGWRGKARNVRLLQILPFDWIVSPANGFGR